MRGWTEYTLFKRILGFLMQNEQLLEKYLKHNGMAGVVMILIPICLSFQVTHLNFCTTLVANKKIPLIWKKALEKCKFLVFKVIFQSQNLCLKIL